MPEIVVLVLLAAGGWFLWDSLKVRETANAAMRAACRQEGLLFLDDTVALQSVWPARNRDGRLVLRRVYAFEFQHRCQDIPILRGPTAEAPNPADDWLREVTAGA